MQSVARLSSHSSCISSPYQLGQDDRILSIGLCPYDQPLLLLDLMIYVSSPNPEIFHLRLYLAQVLCIRAYSLVVVFNRSFLLTIGRSYEPQRKMLECQKNGKGMVPRRGFFGHRLVMSLCEPRTTRSSAVRSPGLIYRGSVCNLFSTG